MIYKYQFYYILYLILIILYINNDIYSIDKYNKIDKNNINYNINIKSINLLNNNTNSPSISISTNSPIRISSSSPTTTTTTTSSTTKSTIATSSLTKSTSTSSSPTTTTTTSSPTTKFIKTPSPTTITTPSPSGCDDGACLSCDENNPKKCNKCSEGYVLIPSITNTLDNTECIMIEIILYTGYIPLIESGYIITNDIFENNYYNENNASFLLNIGPYNYETTDITQICMFPGTYILTATGTGAFATLDISDSYHNIYSHRGVYSPKFEEIITISSGICIPCNSNCKTCKSEDICTSCIDSSDTLMSDGYCWDGTCAEELCDICTGPNVGDCTYCKEGATLSWEGKCLGSDICADGCAYCDTLTEECVLCENNYAPSSNDDTCGPCLDEGCYECSSSSEYSSCLSCDNGYIMDQIIPINLIITTTTSLNITGAWSIQNKVTGDVIINGIIGNNEKNDRFILSLENTVYTFYGSSNLINNNNKNIRNNNNNNNNNNLKNNNNYDDDDDLGWGPDGSIAIYYETDNENYVEIIALEEFNSGNYITFDFSLYDGTNIGTCSLCTSPCLSCNGLSTNCTSCIDGYIYIKNNDQYKTDIYGYNSNFTCISGSKVCHDSNCIDCAYGNEKSTCTECKNGYSLVNGNCDSDENYSWFYTLIAVIIFISMLIIGGILSIKFRKLKVVEKWKDTKEITELLLGNDEHF